MGVDSLVIFGVLVLVSAGMALALVVFGRRREAAAGPMCGHCGYNLTGAPGNRCPECGRLFIEAGVITRPRSRRGLRVVVVSLLLVAGLLFGVFALRTNRQAGAARVQAARARAAAQTAASDRRDSLRIEKARARAAAQAAAAQDRQRLLQDEAAARAAAQAAAVRAKNLAKQRHQQAGQPAGEAARGQEQGN